MLILIHRLRRLDESATIVMYEKGSYVSFANCGLPYYVGNVITDVHPLFALYIYFGLLSGRHDLQPQSMAMDCFVCAGALDVFDLSIC